MPAEDVITRFYQLFTAKYAENYIWQRMQVEIIAGKSHHVGR